MGKSKIKVISVSILAAALVLLLSASAYAVPITEMFRGGLIQVNSFFVQEQFRAYATAIDFFFFSLLFIAVYMMGARYAFKEIKRPEQTIVILLGLMTGFLLVIGGFSATILLPYIHWILYLFLFILLWHLLKGVKSKFWRFVLALLLTLLIIGFFAWLLNVVSPPEIGGVAQQAFGKGDFFSSFADSFKGVDFGGYVPGIPSYVRDALQLPSVPVPAPTGPETPLTTPTPTPTQPEKKGGIFGTGYSWWWLALILLIAIGIWRRKDIGGLFGKKKPGEEPTTKAKGEGTERQKLQEIINEMNNIIELKQKILKKVREVLDKKKKLTKDFLDLYHKKINDPSFYRDKESEEYRNLMQEQDDTTKLLRLELELEDDLIKLREVEEELSGTSLKQGKLIEWGEFINAYYTNSSKYGFLFKRPRTEAMEAAPEFYMQALGKMSAAFKSLMDGNQGVVPEIKEIIAKFFLLAKKEEEVEKLLKQLTDFDKLKYWLEEGKYEKWLAIKDREGDALKQYFALEEAVFFESSLNPKVNLEMRYLQKIVQIIKFLESEMKSFTKLQELRVGVRSPRDHQEWLDITEMAQDQNRGIPAEMPFRIYTNFAEGVPPFKVGCYVNGIKRLVKDVNKKVDVEPVVQFTSDEIGPLTAMAEAYRITVIAVSEKGTYKRVDSKLINIYIGPKASKPSPERKMSQPGTPHPIPPEAGQMNIEGLRPEVKELSESQRRAMGIEGLIPSSEPPALDAKLRQEPRPVYRHAPTIKQPPSDYKLSVKITKPLPNSEFRIGDYMRDLEVIVEGPDGKVVYNEAMSFKWSVKDYLKDGGEKEFFLHRSTHGNPNVTRSSKPIPTLLVPGNAKLRVEAFITGYATEEGRLVSTNRLVAEPDEIGIVLK